MNAGRPRLLRQADDVAFDLLFHLHHEVGHLVDEDDDVRHPVGNAVAFLLVVGLEPAERFPPGLSSL